MRNTQNLATKYKDILEARGLVDGISHLELLKPFYKELMENELLCKPGNATDCSWV
jgi:hypothetical protein